MKPSQLAKLKEVLRGQGAETQDVIGWGGKGQQPAQVGPGKSYGSVTILVANNRIQFSYFEEKWRKGQGKGMVAT